MANVPQNRTNGKVAVTTIQVPTLEQMSKALNLPNLSAGLMDRVQVGLVDTGSEWDGWSLEDIYAALITAGDTDATASAIVDSIMENRYHFARHPLTPIECIEAVIEPWELEPAPNFWEVE